MSPALPTIMLMKIDARSVLEAASHWMIGTEIKVNKGFSCDYKKDANILEATIEIVQGFPMLILNGPQYRVISCDMMWLLDKEDKQEVKAARIYSLYNLMEPIQGSGLKIYAVLRSENESLVQNFNSFFPNSIIGTLLCGDADDDNLLSTNFISIPMNQTSKCQYNIRQLMHPNANVKDQFSHLWSSIGVKQLKPLSAIGRLHDRVICFLMKPIKTILEQIKDQGSLNTGAFREVVRMLGDPASLPWEPESEYGNLNMYRFFVNMENVLREFERNYRQKGEDLEILS